MKKVGLYFEEANSTNFEVHYLHLCFQSSASLKVGMMSRAFLYTLV